MSTTRPIRAALALATATLLTGGVAAPAALADAGTLHASAEFGGWRETGLRVGEPLRIWTEDHAITKVCWSPAPIDRPACSSAILGAPSRAGVQRFTVTYESGSVRRMTRRILPASTAPLPVGSAGAGAADARPLVLRAAMDARGYANFRPADGGLLDASSLLHARRGDRLAAFYDAGHGVTQAFLYRTGRSGFYDAARLRG